MTKQLAHHVKLTVFAHEDMGEDVEKIGAALKTFVPPDLDWEKENLSLVKTIAMGAKNDKIWIFEIFLDKRKQVTDFLDFLKSKLSQDQRELLLHQADSRLDAEMNFFIRFDKCKLLEEGRWWLTDSGKCFHIKITFAAYPARKDVGIGLVKEWLG
jgi:RNA binding exosome subunit